MGTRITPHLTSQDYERCGEEPEGEAGLEMRRGMVKTTSGRGVSEFIEPRRLVSNVF